MNDLDYRIIARILGEEQASTRVIIAFKRFLKSDVLTYNSEVFDNVLSEGKERNKRITAERQQKADAERERSLGIA